MINVKKNIFLFSIILILINFSFVSSSFKQENSFLTQQQKFERVKLAIKEKKPKIITELKQKGLLINNFHLLFIAYKEEGFIELWVKNKKEKEFFLMKEYPICSKSGVLGPKRGEGDFQVPEGFYHINRFNPTSQFYLSLGINYPNQSDRIIIGNKPTGGDIFIHGSCVTIGCLPMTDDLIKEIYLFSVYAKNNGQNKIPIYIFPYKMNETNYSNLSNKYQSNKELLRFWSNIKKGYDKFYSDKKEIKFTINEKGEYVFDI
ncbi:MAG: L,D-transpeptidase family protein [Flavobacteriia bacterium]|nr:L,D-transpeptidase family protein [Flavobacteriia bacterium]